MNVRNETPFAAGTRIVAGDDGTNYDNVAIALHWATAFLVVANFALAQTWDWFAKPTKGLMEDTHMSFGVLLAAVIIARIVWRLMPGHQISSLEIGWVRRASKATHYLLYALLLSEATLGFAFRWGAERPMEFFGLGIPPLIGEIEPSAAPPVARGPRVDRLGDHRHRLAPRARGALPSLCAEGSGAAADAPERY